MDDLIDHGSITLKSTRDQSLTLKSIKTKILNVGNTLGLSSTIMKLIQRRSAGDRKIVFGLMILTCIIMFLTIKYLF
jgi:Golgi SNAP receptor complex protein 2